MNFFDNISAANDAIMSSLGEAITLNSNSVTAIVYLTPAGYDAGGGMLLDKTDPSVTMLTPDFAAITVSKGHAALIRGMNYLVTAIQPDDNGMTTIMLRPG